MTMQSNTANQANNNSQRYPRTFISLCAISILVTLYFSELRLDIWHALLPLFEWMETTVLGAAAKTWGALFAVVEAFHLMSMALLGGAIIIMEARWLNLLLKKISAPIIFQSSHKLFISGLLLAIATGLFMACGVALKVYYLPVFWIKIFALCSGVLFYFFVRRPLMEKDLDITPLWLRYMVSYSSLSIWFLVAASGRWIGFS